MGTGFGDRLFREACALFGAHVAENARLYPLDDADLTAEAVQETRAAAARLRELEGQPERQRAFAAELARDRPTVALILCKWILGEGGAAATSGAV